MVIFGWFVVLLGAIYFSVIAYCAAAGNVLFSGKVGGEWIIPFLIAAVCWYFAISNFPFDIHIK